MIREKTINAEPAPTEDSHGGTPSSSVDGPVSRSAASSDVAARSERAERQSADRTAPHDTTAAAPGSPGQSPEATSDTEGVPPWFLRHLLGGSPLPAELNAVIADVLNPLYRQMVIQEKDPLLRATGNAVVVAHAIELLEQPGVLKAAKRAFDNPTSREEFVNVLQVYLKLAVQRGKTVNLHLQLRRAQHAPWQVPGDPFGIMTRCGYGI